MCYLKWFPGQGIILSSSCDFHLTTWYNYVWASCPFTNRYLPSGCFFLVLLLFLGRLASNILFLAFLSRVSIVPWLMWQLNLNSYILCLVALESLPPVVFLFIVTVSMRSILPKTLSLMSTPSILNLIVITFVMPFKMDSFLLLMFPLQNNLQTFLGLDNSYTY